MEKVTDWIMLWRQLVEARSHSWKKENSPEGEEDPWQSRARSFSEAVRQRWAKPDAQRDLILTLIKTLPDATVLDIGAGTGGWAIPMARHAGKITAIEPSSAMIEVMRENLAMEHIDNVEIIQATWPEVEVKTHDFSLCSHAMYGCPDLAAFVQAMTKATRRICFMLMRAPAHDGTMARAAMKVWGHPHDSPNFQVAYSAMLQIGIYPHVLMGAPDQRPPWTNDSFAAAMGEVKRRLGLEASSAEDAFLQDLLKSRLTFQDGKYVWPKEVRSALVYWEGSGGSNIVSQK